MEPLSITASALTITSRVIPIAIQIHGAWMRYREAPHTVADLVDEIQIIHASLLQLQNLLRLDDVSITSDLEDVFGIAVKGCKATLLCLTEEFKNVQEREDWWARIKIVWKDDRMDQLLEQLGRKKTSLLLLMQCLSLESSFDVRRTLQQHRPKLQQARADLSSLVVSYPQLAAPLVETLDRATVASIAGSHDTVFSDTEFSFDFELINTRVYRENLKRIAEEPKRTKREDDAGSVRLSSDSSSSESTIRKDREESSRKIGVSHVSDNMPALHDTSSNNPFNQPATLTEIVEGEAASEQAQSKGSAIKPIESIRRRRSEGLSSSSPDISPVQVKLKDGRHVTLRRLNEEEAVAAREVRRREHQRRNQHGSMSSRRNGDTEGSGAMEGMPPAGPVFVNASHINNERHVRLRRLTEEEAAAEREMRRKERQRRNRNRNTNSLGIVEVDCEHREEAAQPGNSETASMIEAESGSIIERGLELRPLRSPQREQPKKRMSSKPMARMSKERKRSSTSSINNPKLLQTVEDAIKRLIEPEVTALKEEQRAKEQRRKRLQSSADGLPQHTASDQITTEGYKTETRLFETEGSRKKRSPPPVRLKHIKNWVERVPMYSPLGQAPQSRNRISELPEVDGIQEACGETSTFYAQTQLQRGGRYEDTVASSPANPMEAEEFGQRKAEGLSRISCPAPNEGPMYQHEELHGNTVDSPPIISAGPPLEFDWESIEDQDRISSKDIVALMDHLTVRDAQRTARDAEIVKTLIRGAAEMRTSFEQIKGIIQEQDDLIVGKQETAHDRNSQPLYPMPELQRPGPQSDNDNDDDVNVDSVQRRKQNIFKRALKGLSSKSNNDLNRIEHMLVDLLAEAGALKSTVSLDNAEPGRADKLLPAIPLPEPL